MRKLAVFVGILIFSFSQLGYIKAGNFDIIPEGSGKKAGKAVEDVKEKKVVEDKEDSSISDNYSKKAEELEEEGDLGTQMASGVMNWNTLLSYAVYLVKFLSQLGLVVGAAMVIYAGYIYATSVFTGNASKGTDALKSAVIGVLIVIFAYALMNILTAMFL